MRMTLDFKEAGDKVFLIGQGRNDINSSEYLHKLCGVEYSPAPHFDLDEEYNVQQAVRGLISKGWIRSAHDVSEGGLFVTLCESGFWRNLGFDVKTARPGIRKDAYWFGEAQSRIVVSVSVEKEIEFRNFLVSGNLAYEELGSVTTGSVLIDGQSWGSISGWKEKYENAIAEILAEHESEHALSAL